MSDLHRLTGAEAARLIQAGTLSPVDLVESCLARIEKFEPRVKAWVSLDAEAARRLAVERQEQARGGMRLGPLHGLPVGLKDIYHVTGFVTTAGAGPFFHERPEADAESVARLRHAGAIVLGKTTTTEFANRDPTATGNPWNLEHTPGGSSSGSAASVAAGMVPLALGSQTVGSTLRPAAYCGIVGFKGTYGRVSCAGMIPLAWSFDTVGMFGRSVADVALTLDVLAGYDHADLASVDARASGAFFALAPPPRPPRLAVSRRLLEMASPTTAKHVSDVVERCGQAGAAISEVDLPPSFERLKETGQCVVQAEAAAFHAHRFPAHAERYQEKFRGTLAAGMKIGAADYVSALRQCRRFRRDMEQLLPGWGALLTPVAPAPAPRGLESTGDASLCEPWSYAGLPAIALPSGLADDGLPLGVQLVGAPWQEAGLLETALWVERLLAFRHEPALD